MITYSMNIYSKISSFQLILYYVNKTYVNDGEMFLIDRYGNN